MKHTRLFILGASALALSQWANTAHAESAPPGNGLEEISDAELGDMRGRYTTGDNTVAWFGVKMISTWQTTAGQVLEGAMAMSMNLSTPKPTVSFVPTVNITHVNAPPPAPTPAPGPARQVDASGLANVAGVTQSVQVAGDSNLASNVTHLNVQDGGAIPTSGSGSSTPGAATAYADGASAAASFDGNSANVLLTIDGQGAVSQWIHNGSIGQSVQLAADNQWVSNRMEIDLIRQSMAANTQLAQNVAQSIALARGIGLR
ncbi:hypothetical protein [Dyella sp.]|uniref:hypothetical protein n=1 Tax=Dyella sp. TaxID=1869338 RepID=UPI003F7D2F8C